MQSVGDQVTQLVSNLEREHLATLMRVDALAGDNDSLRATSDALTSANAVLEKQLADRTSALADTEKRMDEALAQVEVVANAALNMLRTVKGQRASLEAVGDITKATNPLWKNSDTPREFTAKDLKMLDLAIVAVAPKGSGTLVVDATQQDTAAIVDDVEMSSAQQVAGDEQSFGEQVTADIMTADNAIESDDAILIGDSEDGHEMVDLSPIKQALEEKLAEPEPAAQIFHRDTFAPPLAPAIAPPVELDAVDRMRRTSDLLPAPTLSRNDGPVLVVRNEPPLPIFLARDTVFGRNDPRL